MGVGESNGDFRSSPVLGAERVGVSNTVVAEVGDGVGDLDMVEVVGEADFHQHISHKQKLTLCPSGLCPNDPAPPPSNTGVLLPILLLLLLELWAPLAEPEPDPDAAGILRGTVCVERGKGGGDLEVYDILSLEL
jgi:hypothetical protein